MKFRRTTRVAVVLSLILLGMAGYFMIVNRNSKDMTGKQKLLKAFYPIITGVTRMFGKNSDVVKNTDSKIPAISIYQLEVKLITGKLLDLRELRGQKIMFVNTASDCGYTRQYEELQQLQNKFAGKLQIIAFPANDFKDQEKGSDEEILKFCKLNYGISFPLASKSTVIKTADQNPIFKWLSDKSFNGWNDKAPTWNFSKYLVDEKGNLTHYFDPSVSPLGREVAEAL
jgi:glutathione peroxidase